MFQCVLLLNADRKMYHAESDTPFVCRTTRLNEELGQVRRGARRGGRVWRVRGAPAGGACPADGGRRLAWWGRLLGQAVRCRAPRAAKCAVACGLPRAPQVQYVLSDKTGTLTQNVMGWVWASIGGRLYGRAGAKGGPPPRPGVPADTPHTIALDQDLEDALVAGDGGAPDPQAGARPRAVLCVCSRLCVGGERAGRGRGLRARAPRVGCWGVCGSGPWAWQLTTTCHFTPLTPGA